MREITETIYVHLKQKRDIRFPFALSVAGIIKTPESASYSNVDYKQLEFCLRLKSPEKETIDELDGKIYKYQFPHLFIKRSATAHKYRIEGARQAIFLIYPSSLETAFIDAGISLDPPGIEFRMTAELERLLETFHELLPCSQNKGSAEKFDLLAFQIIEHIYMQEKTPADNYPEMERIIREIASFFQVNFRSPVDIDEICRKHGISRRSFFRAWSAQYEQSPHQYILELKIKEAERLLLNRHMQVKEIASELGFDNHSYFIQAFKRSHDGIPPGEYRRDILQQD